LDEIKEKLALYREYLRGLILVILALSSGLIFGSYNVLVKKAPFYSLWFLSFGVIVLMVLFIALNVLNNSILELIKELKNGKNDSR